MKYNHINVFVDIFDLTKNVAGELNYYVFNCIVLQVTRCTLNHNIYMGYRSPRKLYISLH